jgi:hypothetical protein
VGRAERTRDQRIRFWRFSAIAEICYFPLPQWIPISLGSQRNPSRQDTEWGKLDGAVWPRRLLAYTASMTVFSGDERMTVAAQTCPPSSQEIR